MRKAVVAGALVALAAPSVARAHVTVLPAYLENGRPTTLEFTAPNERPPHSVTRLTVTFPAGFELRETAAPAGWQLELAPGRATWRRGVTHPHQVGQFALDAKTEREPAGVTLDAVQRYSDGGAVRWTIPFTILPAAQTPPREHLTGALIAGIVGLAVIAVALFLLRFRQPRSAIGTKSRSP